MAELWTAGIFCAVVLVRATLSGLDFFLRELPLLDLGSGFRN
jgi:hypothetical protein